MIWWIYEFHRNWPLNVVTPNLYLHEYGVLCGINIATFYDIKNKIHINFRVKNTWQKGNRDKHTKICTVDMGTQSNVIFGFFFSLEIVKCGKTGGKWAELVKLIVTLN